MKLGLAEVANHPPGARVDEGEEVLANVSVVAFRDGEVGYAGIEGGINTGVVKIVLCVQDLGGTALALCSQGFQRGDRMLRLLVLRFALIESRLGLLILCG